MCASIKNCRHRLTADNTITAQLESIPTRLRSFEEIDQGHLINWGYALADAALRSRASLEMGPKATWPIPSWRLN